MDNEYYGKWINIYVLLITMGKHRNYIIYFRITYSNTRCKPIDDYMSA
jgi:hypothetical protein